MKRSFDLNDSLKRTFNQVQTKENVKKKARPIERAGFFGFSIS
jgi:hypothetical protein